MSSFDYVVRQNKSDITIGPRAAEQQNMAIIVTNRNTSEVTLRRTENSTIHSTSMSPRAAKQSTMQTQGATANLYSLSLTLTRSNSESMMSSSTQSQDMDTIISMIINTASQSEITISSIQYGVSDLIYDLDISYDSFFEYDLGQLIDEPLSSSGYNVSSKLSTITID
jgi:hypothetical protein